MVAPGGSSGDLGKPIGTSDVTLGLSESYLGAQGGYLSAQEVTWGLKEDT